MSVLQVVKKNYASLYSPEGRPVSMQNFNCLPVGISCIVRTDNHLLYIEVKGYAYALARKKTLKFQV